MIALPELTADCLKLMIVYRSKASCLLFLRLMIHCKRQH